MKPEKKIGHQSLSLAYIFIQQLWLHPADEIDSTMQQLRQANYSSDKLSIKSALSVQDVFHCSPGLLLEVRLRLT